MSPFRTDTWIFQGNPDFYRIRDAIRTCSTLTWRVTRYQKEIHPGHRVYLWESGPQGGFVCLATVQDAPRMRDLAESERALVIDPQLDGVQPRAVLCDLHAIDPPLSRAVIKAHPVLADLGIVRQPHSTNYRATASQAEALDAILASREGS